MGWESHAGHGRLPIRVLTLAIAVSALACRGASDAREQQVQAVAALRSTLPAPGASFAPGQFCDGQAWCWYNPLPAGVWWFAAGGAGRDIWIGGDTSAVLHYHGASWTAPSSPLATVSGIWAAATDDVWFVGTGPSGGSPVAHWDGRALSSTPVAGATGFTDVWGAGPADVYAVGYGGVQHYDGASWSAVPNVAGTTVGGSGGADVWIGASDGLWHFDGQAWTRTAELEGEYVTAVAVAGPGDVWVAAAANGVQQVLHFDGQAWTVSYQVPSDTQHNVWGLGVAGPGDVWLVGTTWVASDPRGYLVHFDGTSWREAPVAPTSLYTMKTVSGRRLAVGQNGGLLELGTGAAAGWTDLRVGPAETLSGVWGSSPADVWAVGDAGVALHYDGAAVRAVTTGTTASLKDVWGTGPGDVWAVGDGGTALHFSGTVSAAVPTGVTTSLDAVFTAAAGDVWVGGASATLLHGDGSSFQPVTVSGLDPSAQILDLHGTGPNDVWLSGGGPTGAFVAHFDGTAWSPAQVLNTNNGSYPGRRIWALATNDVWLLTQPVFRGFVDYWHFDGSTWTEVFTQPTPAQWMFPKPGQGGSFAFSPTDRWFVGTLGTWQRTTTAP